MLKKLNQIMKLRKKTQKKRKVVIYTAPKLYGKLLKIYTIQDDRFSENEKKKISNLNRPKMLALHYDEDDLQEGDEEVKLEPEETIAERIKLSPQKRKRKGTRLNILISKKLLIRLQYY